LKIKAFCFSEPCGGKSRCDTYAALIKKHVLRFVNSGHNADTAKAFAYAISSGDGVPNVTVMIGAIKGKSRKPTYHLKDVKKLHNLELHDHGIQARMVAGIGEGVFIDLTAESEKLAKDFDSQYDYEIVNKDQLEENLLPKRQTSPELKKAGKIEIEISKDYEDEDEVDYSDASGSGAIFSCPNNHCSCEFISYDRYEKHLLGDQCKIKVPTNTPEETVKSMYLSAFGVGFTEKVEKNKDVQDLVAQLTGYPSAKVGEMLRLETPLAPFELPSLELFAKGFALPKAKEKVRFKKDVIKYIKEIFEEGMKKEKKATPEEVMLKMRKEKVGQKLRFKSCDWLNDQQIRSLFGRFAAKVKKGQPLTETEINDAEIAEEEEELEFNSAAALATATNDIIRNIEDDIPDFGEHPIMVGEICLCDLAKCLKRQKLSEVFKKVKLEELYHIAEKIEAEELQEKSFKGKERAENLTILSKKILDYVSRECFCFLAE
jgi:hypothetical protein